ncbi:MAG TPA: hypothetical protein VG244_00005 [Acidimicrobiales bacterium]|nr:hypothetical protein [Acidimicrobiales bacterium]
MRGADKPPGPLVANVDVALGQEPKDLEVIGFFNRAQPRCPQRRNRDRVSIVGVVLVGSFAGQHSDASSQRGRHIDHDFTSGHELLGQQIPHPAGGLDGPGPLLEGFGPAHQLFDLTPGRADLHARKLVFVLVDGDRGVRRLVRIDTDHNIHHCLLGL